MSKTAFASVSQEGISLKISEDNQIVTWDHAELCKFYVNNELESLMCSSSVHYPEDEGLTDEQVELVRYIFEDA